MTFKKSVFSSLALCAAIIALIISSCKPKHNDSGNNGQSLDQLFSSLSPTPQSIIVTSGRDTIVYCSGGTALHIYPNSFQTSGGSTIAAGNTIYLQVQEIYSAGDMIRNRTSTVANGVLIQSGGQVSIHASMNSQTVYAHKYGIGFAQGGGESQKMALYYSNSTNSASVVNWTVADTTQPGTMCVGTDSAGYQFFYSNGTYVPPPKPWYYIFDSCTSFHFINCDYWWNYSGVLNPVHLTLADGSFNGNNTQAFLALTSDKVNISFLPGSSSGDFELEEGGVPPGLNYTAVVISNKDGNYYYFSQSGVTSAGMTINAVMAPSTQANVLTQLSGL